MNLQVHKGFTLAELLIALAILGVIATFVIPKILNAQQDERRIAIFRESYSAYQQVLYDGLTRDALDQMSNSQFRNYMTSNLNAIKSCPTDGETQGCCTDLLLCNASNNEAAVILHSGAHIYSIQGSSGVTTPVIDWNGYDGPNTEGEDVLILRGYLTGSKRGRLEAFPNSAPSDGSSITLMNEIFSNN